MFDQIIGIGFTVVLLVVLFGGAAWWSRRQRESRRDRELRDPQRRMHWALITGYMGTADPTRLTVDQARSILDKSWSCPDRDRLLRKIELYRRGELNDAFDVARLLWLAELGRAAVWIQDGETKAWSDEGVARVRRAYRGWAEYGDALLVGRERWYTEVASLGSMPGEQREHSAEARRSAEPIWRSIAW